LGGLTREMRIDKPDRLGLPFLMLWWRATLTPVSLARIDRDLGELLTIFDERLSAVGW